MILSRCYYKSLFYCVLKKERLLPRKYLKISSLCLENIFDALFLNWMCKKLIFIKVYPMKITPLLKKIIKKIYYDLDLFILYCYTCVAVLMLCYANNIL